jgi:hypothetical protein
LVSASFSFIHYTSKIRLSGTYKIITLANRIFAFSQRISF